MRSIHYPRTLGTAVIVSALLWVAGKWIIQKYYFSQHVVVVGRKWINGAPYLSTKELIALLHSPPPRKNSFLGCGTGRYGEFDSYQQPLVDELGRRGSAAVPELTKALADPDPLRRHAAARALQIIGAPAAAAVYRLELLLGESRVGQAAAEALWAAGPKGRAALVRALDRRLPGLSLGNERYKARESARSGAERERLAKLEKEADAEWARFQRAEQRRNDASWGLRRAGDDAWVYIYAVLRSPDPRVRGEAADLAGQMERRAKDATIELASALERESDSLAAYSIMRGLESLGPAAKAAVPSLETRLTRAEDEGHARAALLSITADADTHLGPILRRIEKNPRETFMYLNVLSGHCRGRPEVERVLVSAYRRERPISQEENFWESAIKDCWPWQSSGIRYSRLRDEVWGIRYPYGKKSLAVPET